MSLYVQITERCNMTCCHCAFDCGPRGPEMSAETFRCALDLAEQEEAPLTLGGGEPTLHPMFMEFLWWAIRRQAPLTYELGIPAVSLVTNGSRTGIALELAALARVGVVCASLSRDEFHDPIDARVYRAFEPSTEPGDCRRISRPGFIVPAGRAKNWGNHPFARCVCEGPFIVPSGDIYSCGCRLNRLGSVKDQEVHLPLDWQDLRCPNEVQPAERTSFGREAKAA